MSILNGTPDLRNNMVNMTTGDVGMHDMEKIRSDLDDI